MKKGVILQARDFEVLSLVYEHTVTSFEKLKRTHFQNVNLQTASNRLGRLCHGGLIRKFRAGLVIYQGEPRQVQMVFTITAMGIQALKSRHPDRVIRDEPVPLNSQTLIHDLLLGDVLDTLKVENPDRKVVNAKLLNLESMRHIQVPDGVILGQNGSRDVAVELELTIKSERRYREIVTNYRLQSRFEKVLFVHTDESLITKVAQAVGVEPPEKGVKPVVISKFEFRKLDDLLGSSVQPDPPREVSKQLGQSTQPREFKPFANGGSI